MKDNVKSLMFGIGVTIIVAYLLIISVTKFFSERPDKPQEVLGEPVAHSIDMSKAEKTFFFIELKAVPPAKQEDIDALIVRHGQLNHKARLGERDTEEGLEILKIRRDILSKISLNDAAAAAELRLRCTDWQFEYGLLVPILSFHDCGTMK